jgi:flagellar hook-associated protein 3 FlgL
MRISTSQMYDTGIDGIMRISAGQMKLQNQITTGRRVLTPADDPVASAQALVTTQAQEVNKRYMENQGQAKDSLALLENTLGSVVDVMGGLIERTIQAGNSGALGDSERQIIARELRMRYDQLNALANTRDGEGNFMFAGYQAQTQPFATSSVGNAPSGAPVPGVVMAGVAVPAGADVYQGDDGRRQLQVEASRTMSVSEPGSDVFVRIRDKNGNVTDESVFTSLGKFIEALETTPFDPTTFNAAQNAALTNFYATLDNTLRIQTTTGSRMAEIEALEATAADRDLQYETVLSGLQDLDYAEAFSLLSKQQIQLEASQKSFMAITKLGLFNYI